MNILILSWRDPSNPRSGGAEQVMLKYVTHWTDAGHKVFWLGSRYGNLPIDESTHGLTIHRVGPELKFYNTLTMLLTYPIFLLNNIWIGWGIIRNKKIDLVVDAIHGLPLFSPLYARGRKVLWVCEVAGTIWDKMYPFPINHIGKFLERIVYLVYRNCEIWAISESTKRDILKINPNLKIKIIPLGIDISKFKPATKFNFPSALFVARLVKMKGIESALRAAREISKNLPKFKLFVVGDGDLGYVQELKDYVNSNHLQKNVEFLGKVSDQQRNTLYAKSHFLIHSSFKEGFGLTVLEAAASGTPTIAKKGSSMDELIVNDETGLLFDDDRQIATLFLKYFGNKEYMILAGNTSRMSRRYNWKQILSSSKKITHI